MRLKARPDLHHAALPDGVFVSSATGEFALSGWPGFADLTAQCLPLLGEGCDEDVLVRAIGTEQARPAVRQLLSQLETHDMVLRLDALKTGEPNAEARSQHAELLAYLECLSAEPYAAFAEVRSARIQLVGPDAAVAAASSALNELGIEAAADDDVCPPDVAIVLMRRERVEDAPPHTARLLPVVVGPTAVLVGPLVDDLQDWTQWRTLADRTLERGGSTIDGDAAGVVGASVAVQLLLQDLASVAGPDAYVVAGDTLEVHPLDVPAHVTPELRDVSLDTASDDGHDPDLVDWLAWLTDPWLGLVRTADEEALPQMPVALRRFVTTTGQVILAEGSDQEAATGSGALAIARQVAGAGAAGTSELRWLLDGALCQLTPRAGTGRPFTVVDSRGERLIQALQDGAGSPQLTVHEVPSVSWVLVRCTLTGGQATAGWGPDVDTAAADALSRAVAVHQLPADAATLQGRAGTAALESVPRQTLRSLAADVTRWLAQHSLRLIGQPHPADPQLGPGPLRSGHVSFVAEESRPDPAKEVTQDRLVEALGARTGADIVTTLGWDHDSVASAVGTAQESGRELVPLQIGADAIVAGPLWSPSAFTGCPACAEIRRRMVLDHIVGTDLKTPVDPTGPAPASLLELAITIVESTPPLGEGQVVVVSTDGVQRHHVLRHPACPWCRPMPDGAPPAGLDLVDARIADDDPTRVDRGTPLLDAEHLDAMIDERYGPVRGILREKDVPYAMSMAVLAGGPAMGHGRALAFERTKSVAVLEAYERSGGFPYEAPIVVDRTYHEVSDDAVDPLLLGRYSEEQLAHPTSKVEPYRPDLSLDWAWGTELATGRPRLVPAEVGFYQYDHAFKRDVRGSRAATPEQRRRVFLESSSGCALGSGVAEATIHALFEVAERDAFLLSWHRARPLPRIPAAELADPVVEALAALVESRGFDVHFLRATQDVELPVIWVLAIARNGGFPASFSSAGSGADPVSAARSGLCEVAQLATMPLDWDQEDARALTEDSWRVSELEDHVRWSSAPEKLDRIRAVLGGPDVSLNEAFPGWPGVLRPSDGNIVSTLRLVTERFDAAGLNEIVVVDQSTCEHRDQGIHVVKAVVPGTVPMVFGQAHQRLLGIPRFDAALRGLPTREHPFDPHPFP